MLSHPNGDGEKMTPREIASHLLYECIGDNCPCIDWPEEECAVLESLTLAKAQDIVDEELPSAYGADLDYSDDGDALASAGMGTDEDYGYFGDE